VGVWGWRERLHLIRGGTRLYCPEGSQALPACPSDKNIITMDASVERWWNDDGGKRKSEACIAVSHTLVAGLPARSQYPEGPATGHLSTGFSWFPCV